MRYAARIYVTLKPTVNDPQGNAVLSGLAGLGFAGVGNVRVGKFLTLDLEAVDEPAARHTVQDMCDRLLANPVIETYRVELAQAQGGG